MQTPKLIFFFSPSRIFIIQRLLTFTVSQSTTPGQDTCFPKICDGLCSCGPARSRLWLKSIQSIIKPS